MKNVKKIIILFSFFFLVNVAFGQSKKGTDPFGNSYIDPISNTSYSGMEEEGDNTPASDRGWSWKTGIVTSAPPPPTPVPIDGGVGLLLLAGVGYGIRRLRKK